MLTPQLNAELKRFGLKTVPRRKACRLLNDIYEKTHPMVPDRQLHEQLCQFVKARPSLHKSILLYEPVILGELYTQVRAAGVKCTRAQLQVSRRCISGFQIILF